MRFELDHVQGLYQEAIRKVDKKTAKQVVPSTSPAIRSRPESRTDFVGTHRTARHFNLDTVAQEQMSADLDAETAPESMPSMGELEAGQVMLLSISVTLPGLTPASGSQGSAVTSRLRELQDRLQSRTPEINC